MSKINVFTGTAYVPKDGHKYVSGPLVVHPMGTHYLATPCTKCGAPKAVHYLGG